jgi:hypothetical protein
MWNYSFHGDSAVFPPPAPGPNGFYSETVSIDNFIFDPELDEYSLDFDRETFDRERRLWLEQGLQEYSFHVRYRDYGDEPEFWQGIVTVKGGAPDRYDPDENNLAASPEIMHRIGGISNFYNTVEQMAETGWGRGIVVIIKMEYDDSYHYPSYFNYSHNVASPPDGKYYFTVSIDGLTAKP